MLKLNGNVTEFTHCSTQCGIILFSCFDITITHKRCYRYVKVAYSYVWNSLYSMGSVPEKIINVMQKMKMKSHFYKSMNSILHTSISLSFSCTFPLYLVRNKIVTQFIFLHSTFYLHSTNVYCLFYMLSLILF